MSSLQQFARPGSIVNHLYFANSSFLNDGSIIVSSHHNNQMAFYRVIENQWIPLAKMTAFDPSAAANARPNINFRYSGVIAHAIGRFFWIDGNFICSCNAYTGADDKRVELPGVAEIGEPLSYYPGGDYIFFFVIRDNRTTFGRMHIATSRVEWGPQTDFYANHVQAFSADGDLFLFARESTCINHVWIHNPYRVWVGSFKTGQIASYYEHENLGGDHFEHIGHEMTDYATGTVIAARYRSSPVGQAGLVRLKTGTKAELMWAGAAWHPCISGNGKRVILDCQPENDSGISSLLLLDLESNTTRIVGESRTRGGHPYHPHPCIDHDGKHIAYITRDMQSDDASVCVLTL